MRALRVKVLRNRMIPPYCGILRGILGDGPVRQEREMTRGDSIALKRAEDGTWEISSSRAVKVTRSGIVFSGRLNIDEWEKLGQRLMSFADSASWWIADWLAYGETAFLDRYQEAIRKTSLSYQTLRNYAWVARRFELSRRRDALSFGHHAEVAALDPHEQDFWLRKADELHWSRNRLRSEVRQSLRERRATSAD